MAREAVRRSLSAVGATAAVAVLTGAWLGVAQPALAAYRGTNGSIVFTSTRTGTSQLYLRKADGTERQLTTGTGASAPTFSPDGTKIAYTHGSDIWVMHADGTHQANLTRNARNNMTPTWSPDGTKIAFTSTRDVSTGEVYTMPAAGGTPHRVTHNALPEQDLDWSPIGGKIVFDAHAPGTAANSQIYSVAVGTGTVTRLTNNTDNDSNPDWSPDGASIAFVSDRDSGGNLWRMNADGSGQSPVGTPNVYSAPVAPAWSPDGTAIIVGANMGLGSLQLWSVDPSSGSATRLTTDSGNPVNAWPDEQPLHTPAVALSRSSGPVGSAVTVSGSDFLSVQTVKISFIDAKKHVFALGTSKTSAAGAFTKSVKVPSAAAKGAGHFKATGVGGLSASAAFTRS